MNVFVSHSKKDRKLIEPIVISLEGQGHEVFFDEDDLPAGDEYDGRIRKAIDDCDLFVFCISRNSLATGSYAVSELEVARAGWKHPRGHLLPVLLDPAMSFDEIPDYLKAVTVLRPKGNLAAEVSNAVDSLGRMRMKRWAWIAAAILLVGLLVAIGLSLRPSLEDRVAAILKVAVDLESKGEYQPAVSEFDKALKLAPGSLPAHAGKAKALYRTGKYDDAARVVEAGLALPWDRGNESDAATMARMRLIRATIKMRDGQSPGAQADLNHAFESLAPFSSSDSLGLKASIQGTLGGIYQKSDRIEEAGEAYRSAIAFGQQAGDDRGVISDQHNYASLLRGEKKFAEAEQLLRSALTTALRLGFHESQVYVWWGLARTYEEAAAAVDARNAYLKALELLGRPEIRLANKLRTLGKVQGDYGSFLVDQVIATGPGAEMEGKAREAESILKESLKLGVGGGAGEFDLEGVGVQCANLGRLLLHTGREQDGAALIVAAHAVLYQINPTLVTREGDEEVHAAIVTTRQSGLAPDFNSESHLQNLVRATGIPSSRWKAVFDGVPPPPQN